MFGRTPNKTGLMKTLAKPGFGSLAKRPSVEGGRIKVTDHV